MSRTQIDLTARSKSGPVLPGVELYLLERNGSLDRAPDLTGLAGSARDSAIADFIADETLVDAYTTEAGLNTLSYPVVSDVEGRFPDVWPDAAIAADIYVPSDSRKPLQRWGSPPSERITLNDDFARIDGPLGVDPSSGYLWTPTGTGLPNIAGGAFVNSVANGVGYAITRMDTKPVEVGGTFSLHPGGGTDAANCTIIAASGSSDLQNLVHPDFSRTNWVIQKRINGSWTVLSSGTFDTPLAADAVIRTYGWRLDGSTITVTWPDGTESEVTDADFASLHSAVCFWEIVEQANSPKVKWRSAYAKEAV